MKLSEHFKDDPMVERWIWVLEQEPGATYCAPTPEVLDLIRSMAQMAWDAGYYAYGKRSRFGDPPLVNPFNGNYPLATIHEAQGDVPSTDLQQ